MGWFLDLLKYTGIIGVMTTEGTVFGGKAGDGILGKVIIIIPTPPPKPPVPHPHEKEEKHYPEYKIHNFENPYLFFGINEPYRIVPRKRERLAYLF